MSRPTSRGRHRPGHPRLRRRRRRRPVLTNAHNVRGDEVTVTFRDGRSERGTRGRRSTSTATSRSSPSTRRAPPRSPGPTARPGGRRRSSSARRRRPAAGARVTVGHDLGHRAVVPRPRRPPDRRQPRAHRAAGAGLVRRRRSLDADGRLLGSTPNRIGEGFYLALPADSALRERVEALGARRVGSPAAAGHRGRPVASRATSASRSGCRSVTASSSAASRTTARRHGRDPRRRPDRRDRRARRHRGRQPPAILAEARDAVRAQDRPR